ncbi:MAG: phosphate ABC transporter substrate-binding protein [Anaerolineaceae bacterium]
MKSRLVSFLLACFFILTACSQASSQAGGQDVSGYIENKGSDTIVNLALAWAERYQTIKPDVRISVTGGGSGTGIASLINGTVDLANASRAIKPEEIEMAENAGITPVETIIARDAIAVIVNPENPVDRLTLEQISRIFSGEIDNWKEVGGDDRPIVRLSRETNSGTHVYFLETVIRLGNSDDTNIFSDDTLLLPSSEGIISEVRDNPNAIGYDGLGYVVPEVKILEIAKDENSSYILPSVETVNDKTYPISRDLYIYSQGEPTGIIKDYLDWILSAEAQEIVTDLGFVPYLEDQ